MADDGSQQRKPNFRTAVEDLKALATVLTREPESDFGSRLNFRSAAGWAAIGVGATLVVALVVVITLLLTGGGKAVSDNAALIGALVALGGVFTTQLVNIALEDRRTRTESTRTAERAQDSALQAFLDQISQHDAYSELRKAPVSGHKRAVLRAQLQTLLLPLHEERKGVLLSFLHEAKLIRKEEITPYEHTKKGSEENGEERWNYPILRLNDIDFSRTELSPDTKLTFDDLRGIILRSAKLSKVNLSGANLNNADLRDADLRGAVLRRANREDADKIPGEVHTDVDKAKMRGEFPKGLMETDLREADLSRADLSRADLSRADSSANLQGALLQRAHLRGADLRGADLQEADLRGADLRGADLEGATLIRACLTGVHLRAVNLNYAKLNRADLRGALLESIDLNGADLREADIRNVRFTEVSLRGAKLNGAHLQGADMREMDPDGATFQRAVYDQDTAWPSPSYPDQVGAELAES